MLRAIYATSNAKHRCVSHNKFIVRKKKEVHIKNSVLCRVCGLPLSLNFGTSLGKKLLYTGKLFGNLLLREAGVYVLYMAAKVAHYAYRCWAVWHRARDCWLVRSDMKNIFRGRCADHAAPTAPTERFVVLNLDMSADTIRRALCVAALAHSSDLLVEYHYCTFNFLNRPEISK